ncbi:acyltransferase [Demequina soli]|uniref:acyltransferase n=1 Tax=Demequina soli TaxID=1638987 RepID=UPI0009E3FD60
MCDESRLASVTIARESCGYVRPNSMSIHWRMGIMNIAVARDWAWARMSDLEMASIHAVCKLPIHAARKAILRLWGAKIGPGVTIYHGLEVRAARKLTIGANTSVGNDAILDARGGIAIGANVNLSTAVHIWSGQHDWRSSDFEYSSAPVRVGDRVWLSARSTVLPGVDIGNGVVLAAHAVASRDLPEFTVCAGVPAAPIVERPRQAQQCLPSAKSKAWWW